MDGTSRLKIMISDDRSRIRLVDEFLMGDAPIFRTVARLSTTMRELNLPFAISGALAVNHYGHLRATADVDIPIRRDDLNKFKQEHLGRGWLEKFEGSKGFRDTFHYIPVDVRIAGDFPGDGKPKPICFPDPSVPSVVEFDAKDGLPYLALPRIIELKLASGMTAVDRPRDFDDVIQLIRINQLPASFGNDLHPYVHEAWTKYWDVSQHNSDEH